MKNTLKLSLILILSSITISNWHCGLVGDVLDGDDNPAQYAISPDRYDVSPFETVTLTIDEYYFSEDSYYGEIYDKEVQLIKLSGTQLTFMMPFVPEGERILEFILEDVTHDIEFTIQTLEEIQNPDEVITTYKDNVIEAFDELKNMNQLYNLEIEPQNLQVIEKYISDFNNAYSSATAYEKQELAQFMNANPDLFDFSNFDYSLFNDSLNTSRSFVKWDQRLTHDMQYYTGLVIATGATVALFNGALVSLNPFAIAITGAALVVEVVLLKQQSITILNRSYKPFEFDINNELRSGIVEFENNIEYLLGIDATYRTMYKNDQNSSDLTIELVSNINTVTGYWNQVLENIPGTSGNVSNLNDQNNYNVNPNRSSVTPQYISIENISNSNVLLSSFSNTDAVRVTFTTTSDEDQIFKFDVVYKNPDFSTETITVSAKIIPEYVGPHEIFLWSGDNQVGYQGQLLENPIEVKVIDKYSNPFAGAAVHFNADDGSTSSTQVITDENGIARVNWTLGYQGPSQSVSVSANEEDGITPLTGSPLKINATTCDPPVISLIEQESCNFNTNYMLVIRFSYYDPNGRSIQNSWRPVNGSAYCYYMPTLISGTPSDGIYEYQTYSQICCCGPDVYDQEQHFYVLNECGEQSNIIYFFMIP